MELAQVMDVLDEMNAEMNNLKKTYQTRAQEIFKEAFKTFFDANPNVKAFAWRQYTPYFNDGEECVFNCYADYGWATNAEDYDNIHYGEYSGDDESVWVDDPDYGDHNPDLLPEETAKALSDLRAFLSRIDDDVFLQMFGNHVTITATRDGFDIDHYDHD